MSELVIVVGERNVGGKCVGVGWCMVGMGKRILSRWVEGVLIGGEKNGLGVFWFNDCGMVCM